MGFFDDVSRQVSSCGRMAAKKTRDVSDTVKLNAQVMEEERKVNNLYAQLGRQYYSLHTDREEPEFYDLVNTIRASETKINVLKKQIQDIKGTNNCKNCGAEVAKGAAFCSVCGAAVPKEEAAPGFNNTDFIKCPGCGAEIEKGTNFCTSCGTPLTAENKAADSSEDLPEAEEPVKNLCPGCGAEIDGSNTFCTECGMKLK